MRLEDELSDLERVSNILEIAPVTLDFITSICGKHLSSGVYRSVFNYNLDDNYVIKIEPKNTNCNIVEYMIWDEVKGLINSMSWVKAWFAPCKWISPNGRILVMRKTGDNYKKKKPNKIPTFLWDVKENNFGWIGNKFVCHDYGQLYNMVHYPKKFKKVNW